MAPILVLLLTVVSAEELLVEATPTMFDDDFYYKFFIENNVEFYPLYQVFALVVFFLIGLIIKGGLFTYNPSLTKL